MATDIGTPPAGDADGRGRARALRWAGVGVPALLMAVLAFWNLGRPSLFGSEAEGYWAARLPIGSLFHLLSHVDAVHGTYYLTVRAWLTADDSVTWLRTLSAVAMTGAVAMTSVIARRLTGSIRVGLIAGVLLALLPSVNSWAQSGRPYALVTLAVTVLIWTLLRALDPPALSRRRWATFAAATTVCGYLHEMTLLLVPAFAITLLLSRTTWAVRRRWLVATAVGTALVLPLLAISSRERNAVGYLRPPGRYAVVATFHQFFGEADIVAWTLIIAVLFGVAAGLRSRHDGMRLAARLGAAVLVVPVTLLFVESRYGKPLFDDRYVLYSTVVVAVLAAIGLDRVGTALVSRLRSSGTRAALVAVPALLACLLAATLQWKFQRDMRTSDGHHENYRGATSYLAAHAHPGDVVVFTSGVAHSAKMAYPEAFTGLQEVIQARTPQQAGTFSGRTLPDSELPAALLPHSRVWAIGPYLGAHSPHSVQALRDVLRAGYRRTLTGRFAGVLAVLYVRRTHR